MSAISSFWRRLRRRWYRRGMDRTHDLRRKLAYHVIKQGFEIGDYSYGAPIIRQYDDTTRLFVGKYCSFAEGVEFILGGMHLHDHVTTFPFTRFGKHWPETAGPYSEDIRSRGDVVVGSDVWIATGATILSGVRIGDGAVIGARAVVTRDVPPYGLAAGNPARLIRRRFPDPIIEALLEIRWWDFERDDIRSLLPLLRSNKVESFIEECRRLRKRRSP